MAKRLREMPDAVVHTFREAEEGRSLSQPGQQRAPVPNYRMRELQTPVSAELWCQERMKERGAFDFWVADPPTLTDGCDYPCAPLTPSCTGFSPCLDAQVPGIPVQLAPRLDDLSPYPVTH